MSDTAPSAQSAVAPTPKAIRRAFVLLEQFHAGDTLDASDIAEFRAIVELIDTLAKSRAAAFREAQKLAEDYEHQIRMGELQIDAESVAYRIAFDLRGKARDAALEAPHV